jgi:hypothetical protein
LKKFQILGEVDQVQRTIDYNTAIYERFCTEIENLLKAVRLLSFENSLGS